MSKENIGGQAFFEEIKELSKEEDRVKSIYSERPSETVLVKMGSSQASAEDIIERNKSVKNRFQKPAEGLPYVPSNSQSQHQYQEHPNDSYYLTHRHQSIVDELLRKPTPSYTPISTKQVGVFKRAFRFVVFRMINGLVKILTLTGLK